MADSPISGKGLFVMADIEVGQAVIRLRGRLLFQRVRSKSRFGPRRNTWTP